ncbi:uncharacterized protein LOC141922496 isoform X5 [Strix aluco]|uniref:uncharacterized protein LOC141922496 isoform X5 n=1 Tax=Strix aluco TaxID=111821 RepID=UPI003DA3FD1C
MAAAGPDLYERLQIRYPPSPPARAPAPAAPPAASGCALGTALAVATGVLLVLGAALVTLIVLHVQGQAELRAAQAELAAVGAPLLLDPDGSQSPAKSPAAAQRQKEQLGEHKAWGDAEAACRSSHSHLASITSPEEQDYLAREARGRPYWIGLTATGPGGSWRWVDGAAYSQAQSFWAPGQPDSTDHGKWGLEGCAQIHPVGNGLWNDHNCNFSFAWICKRDLSRP